MANDANEFFNAIEKCLHKVGGQGAHLVYFGDGSWRIETFGDEVITSGQGLHDLVWWVNEQLSPEAPHGI